MSQKNNQSGNQTTGNGNSGLQARARITAENSDGSSISWSGMLSNASGSENGLPITSNAVERASQEAQANSLEEVRQSSTPWMDTAKGELGQKEIRGTEHNQRIIEYHATTRLAAKTDETPWCSSFVNWSMTQNDYSGTGGAAASSWLTWGKPIEKPVYGAIAVFSHHVGFVAGSPKKGFISILGGNQGPVGKGSVKYSIYKIDKVMSFRLPNRK